MLLTSPYLLVHGCSIVRAVGLATSPRNLLEQQVHMAMKSDSSREVYDDIMIAAHGILVVWKTARNVGAREVQGSSKLVVQCYPNMSKWDSAWFMFKKKIHWNSLESSQCLSSRFRSGCLSKNSRGDRSCTAHASTGGDAVPCIWSGTVDLWKCLGWFLIGYHDLSIHNKHIYIYIDWFIYLYTWIYIYTYIYIIYIYT